MGREPSERVDVCVVGAGPAGALAASSLASDGHDVVVLEAGPRFDFESRQRRMEEAIRPGHHGSVWEMGGERDAFSATGEQYYPLNVARVKGVGGSTLHWQGMVMRLHPTDFDGGHGNDDPAWPIGYDDLRPYYADAERALGVAGDADNPFAPAREDPFPLPGFPPSHSDSLFAEACEALGITTHSVPNARNSEGYDGRSACVGYGTCQPVCPSGAKYDASVHIQDAEAAGARVVDRVPVQRLETDGDGRVSAAVYATPDGTEHRQAAREFVLAAGGVEIPRLLLLSRSAAHPDGLANASGLVGRYFMDHLFAGAGGTLDRETRQNHVGFITSECHQFYDDPGQAVERIETGETVVPSAGERLSPIKLEFLNYAGPSPVELALDADDWATRCWRTSEGTTAPASRWAAWSASRHAARTGSRSTPRPPTTTATPSPTSSGRSATGWRARSTGPPTSSTRCSTSWAWTSPGRSVPRTPARRTTTWGRPGWGPTPRRAS